jgi:hypothetical protein
MGFMDKLRSVASAITGGGAKVALEIAGPSRNQPFTINVTAEVGGNDLKIEKVYVKLKGEERVKLEVEVPEEEQAAATAGEAATEKPATEEAATEEGAAAEEKGPATKEISRTEITFQQEFELAGAQTLNENQTYTWTGEVQLPEDAKPTYKGVNATHEWKLMAGLSAFGNDPDSGWKTIDV